MRLDVVAKLAGDGDAIKTELESLQARIQRPESSDSPGASEPGDGPKSVANQPSDGDDFWLRRVAFNVRIAARSRAIAAEIRLGHVLARSALLAAAVAIFIFGLLMFNLALYFALEKAWGSIWAAVALGAVNLLVAAGFAVLAFRVRPPPELAAAREIGEMASEAALADVRHPAAKLDAITRWFEMPFNWWTWKA